MILKDGAVMVLMIASVILTITEGRTGAMTGGGNMTGTETETGKKAMTKVGEGISTEGRITNTAGEKVVVRAIETRIAGEMITGMTGIAVRGMSKKIIKGMIEETSEEVIQEATGGEMTEEMIEGAIEEMMSNRVISELSTVEGAQGRRWWGTNEYGEVHLTQRLSHHGRRMLSLGVLVVPTYHLHAFA